MNDSKLKVLLYTNGSYQAFSASVYTAKLLQNNPNLHLTILQVQDVDEGSKGGKYSWTELRFKYKSCRWTCSSDLDKSWMNIWPDSPDSKWLKQILHDSDLELRKQYVALLAITNNIFSKRKENVHHQKLCLNTSFSETSKPSETVETIVDYATKNLYDLIIIGTRGLSRLQRVIFGSLSHDLLNKSTIPVLLIEKLPRTFIDGYLSASES
ncbi:Universal stress family protein [Candidatus Desulfosporosinus infrequens]|uniref:Universal stress family protein n=1 Tax=Candidatus Desulfosporosinus infrequens TaxID=2043169 RepID=A0A2U3KX37_9FIRM|nr:Universal stress family protein [Candidatus Desulfosporosinus infrequens]